MNKNQGISMLVSKAVFSAVILLALALPITSGHAAPATYAAAVMADHPIGYWRLNETSTADPAVDLAKPNPAMPNEGNGKYSATGISLGKPGFHPPGDTAALFDGRKGTRIVVPNSESLNPHNITMEAKVSWFGPSPGPTPYPKQRILEKSYWYDPGQEYAQYALFIEEGHVRVEIRTGLGSSVDPICPSTSHPGNRICAKSTAVVVPRVETHVVATYDGNYIRIYLNGMLDSTTLPAGDRAGVIESLWPNPTDPPCDGGCDLGIGNKSVDDQPFYGLIDEVALFGEALSEDKIRTHFQAQLKTQESQYAVKVVCGKSKGVVVAPGDYFTAINVHNPNERAIDFKWKFAVALPGDRRGPVSKFSDVRLGPDEAFEIDCPDIFQKMETKEGFVKGFAVIESAQELDVVAVYTAAGATGRVETMEIERVKPRRQGGEEAKPDLIPVPDPKLGFCRRNDLKLTVTVKNQASVDSGPSITTVDFGAMGAPSLPTPALAAGASTDLVFDIPPGCFDPNCEFKITVDSKNQVNESDEANNTASDECRG